MVSGYHIEWETHGYFICWIALPSVVFIACFGNMEIGKLNYGTTFSSLVKFQKMSIKHVAFPQF